MNILNNISRFYFGLVTGPFKINSKWFVTVCCCVITYLLVQTAIVYDFVFVMYMQVGYTTL